MRHRPRSSRPRRGIGSVWSLFVPDLPPIDGRRLRSERSRKRLIDATISYIETHNGFPTAAALAEHSGIAHRSIFRLFDSLDDIRSAVIADVSKDAGALFLVPDVTLPLADRIAQIAKIRSTANEKLTPVRRFAMGQVQNDPGIEQVVKMGNGALQRQLADLFAVELAAMSTAERKNALNTMDLALSWGAWERLRSFQGLSKAAAQRVIVGIVTAALAA